MICKTKATFFAIQKLDGGRVAMKSFKRPNNILGNKLGGDRIWLRIIVVMATLNTILKGFAISGIYLSPFPLALQIIAHSTELAKKSFALNLRTRIYLYLLIKPSSNLKNFILLSFFKTLIKLTTLYGRSFPLVY